MATKTITKTPWNKGKKGVQPWSNASRKKLSETNKKNGVRPPVRYGPLSEQTKKKISEIKKGKPTWSKGKKLPEQSKRLRGENNPNWNGGSSFIGQAIRTSIEYRLWRAEVFMRDNFTCQHCGQRGGTLENRLEADHIKPFSKHPELIFELSNGRTLCKNCHKKTPTYGYRKK